MLAQEAATTSAVGLGHVAALHLDGRRAPVGGLLQRSRSPGSRRSAGSGSVDVFQEQHLAAFHPVGVVQRVISRCSLTGPAFDGAVGLLGCRGMRSESRTEETSGLVTTRLVGVSAWPSARRSRCRPANRRRCSRNPMVPVRSARARRLPCVSASLSRVWLAARMKSCRALVLDERLRQVGFAVDDVDRVIDHAALAPMMRSRGCAGRRRSRSRRLEAAQRGRRAKGWRWWWSCRPALAGRDDDDLGGHWGSCSFSSKVWDEFHQQLVRRDAPGRACPAPRAAGGFSVVR